MIPFGRRGQCPSLKAPMETGDGLLLRLPPLNSALEGEQWRHLSRLSSKEGNGIIEITQRGNIQLRGFDEASALRVSQSLTSLVSLPRSSVAISCEPFLSRNPSPKDKSSPTDCSTSESLHANNLLINLLESLDSSIDEAGLHLAPKCSIVIESLGLWGYAGLSADIRLRQESGVASIGVGGNAEEARWFQAMDNSCSLLDAAMRVLRFMSEQGPNTRGKEVKTDPALEKILLEVGFIADSIKRNTPLQRLRSLHSLDRIILASRRTSLGLVDEERALVALPYGSLDASALDKLADCCIQHDVLMMPLPQRRLLLMGNAAREVLNHAASEGYIVDVSDVRLRVFACQGAPRCASGCINTRELAHTVGTMLDHVPEAALGSIHISGCAKGCAKPSPTSLTLVGQPDKHSLAVIRNGSASDTPDQIIASSKDAIYNLIRQLS